MCDSVGERKKTMLTQSAANLKVLLVLFLPKRNQINIQEIRLFFLGVDFEKSKIDESK